ncbi:hypothetical protein MGYG_08609 [Nannizzia gypsea CBS 118893]|uniref:Uncharacterized protein n=1 Tax=Arthroderma gypseum (strain ATCC MYA-4604 / CBS 118893) TaxID=535722 RepID=E4V6H0_ARTGP|nr:hypothetical protein MGYG_08609 [Nannizzia gypsea CBS 118893]EFQ96686.1 hypothetical protein MGYG_08609 [Nannizzia gypsea CBS 118893]
MTCPDGSIWSFGKKIKESSFLLDYDEDEPSVAESKAVYHCHQVKGPNVGMEAIAKVRMQVPTTYPASPIPQVRACEAFMDKVAYPTAQEIQVNMHLNEKNCTVAPRLLHYLKHTQTNPSMPVPGGYIVILIMEKCPGVPLIDFWQYDEAKKREDTESVSKFLSCFVDPEDPGLQNIIYDEQEDKCWFIDHEQTFITESKYPTEFRESYFRMWGLKD